MGPDQGGPRRCQARFGLTHVADIAPAGIGKPLDVGEAPLVRLGIIFGDLDQGLRAQHLDIGQHGIERGGLGRIMDPLGRRADARLLPLDLASGGVPVEQQLTNRRLGLDAQQPLVVDGRAVGPFRSGGGPDIEQRKVTRPRLAQFVIHRAPLRSQGPDVGVGVHGLTNRFFQCHRLCPGDRGHGDNGPKRQCPGPCQESTVAIHRNPSLSKSS